MPTAIIGSPYGSSGYMILGAPGFINDILMAYPNLELYYWFQELYTAPVIIDYSGNNRDATITGTATRPGAFAVSTGSAEFNGYGTDGFTSSDFAVQSNGTPVNVAEGTVSVFYRAVDGQIGPSIVSKPALIVGLSDGTGNRDKVIQVNPDGSITGKVWDTVASEWVGVTAPAAGVKLDRWMLLNLTFVGGTITFTINDPSDPYYFTGTASYGGSTVTDFSAFNVRVAGGWDGTGAESLVGMPGYYDEFFIQRYDPTITPAPVWSIGLSMIVNTPLRDSWVAGEAAIVSGTPADRVTQYVGEVLRDSGVSVRRALMTQIQLEVVRTSSTGRGVPLFVTDTAMFSGSDSGLSEISGGRIVGAVDTVTFSDSGHTQRIGVSASDTVTFSDTAGYVGKHHLSASDTVTFSDSGSEHDTNVRVSATDTVTFGATDSISAVYNRPAVDLLILSDVPVGHDTNVLVGAVDSVTFSDQGGNPQTYSVYATDDVLFSDPSVGGRTYSVYAIDTATFLDFSPGGVGSSDLATFSDEADVFNPAPHQGEVTAFSDVADVGVSLGNPSLGLSRVLQSGVSGKYPFTYTQTPDGLVLIANGVDPVFVFNPADKKVVTAGVIAPVVPVTLTATAFVNTDVTGAVIPSPSYTAYIRFVDRYGNQSNLSPISVASLGEAPFAYDNVAVPTEGKVVRRQILRNPAGSANVYYVEIDTTDLTSTSFVGTMDDETLLQQEPQAILDSSGNIFANIYSPPPSHKSSVAYHLGRVFLAVEIEYSDGHCQVTVGSTTVTGIGTTWVVSMIGRAFYGINARDYYTIVDVDPDAQTLTLSSEWIDPTNRFCTYTIRPGPEERRLVYYSEALLPEAWPPTYAITVMEDGDEITGAIAFNSFLYIFERRNSYKFTFRNDPQTDGNIFKAVSRGVVSQRCLVTVDDVCYLLDDLGVYSFDGNTATPISQLIQSVFQGDPDDGLVINWDADTRLWHASWDAARETIRWFVSFGVDPEPRNALCYQYRLQRWWVEQYDRPITSSSSGQFTHVVPFVGSTGRSVLALGQGHLDGADPTLLTRFNVASAGPVSILASAPGALANSFVGCPVGVASGRGSGQVRTIVGVSGNTLLLDRPWMIAPDTTSVCQVGGFAWTWQSGWFRFEEDEEGNPRDVEVVYNPTKRDGSFDVSLYYDHEETPRPWAYPVDEDGVKVIPGATGITVATKGYGGFFCVRQEGHREIYIGGDQFISVALSGVAGPDVLKIYQVNIAGCSAKEEPQ